MTCGECFGLNSFPGQHLPQPILCRACESVPPPFIAAVSHGAYQGNLRALIHLLKYEGIVPAARPLGKLLADSIAQIEPRLDAQTVVVAVPLHAAKERQRGFNQAERVAVEALAEMRRKKRAAGYPDMPLKMNGHVLHRAKPTESQFGLTAHQRRKNLKGAFTVARATAIAGKTVLLVDDIYTSGATARECSRTLLAAGAAEVYVATLARAQWDGVAHWDATQFVAAPITFQAGESRLATRF